MGRGRGIPGTLPMMGSHRITPAATATRARSPRATIEFDWAATMAGAIDPTSSTVTQMTATGGRWTRIRVASMGAGLVAHQITSSGSPTIRRGATARTSRQRCSTKALTDQCAARSPSGQPRHTKATPSATKNPTILRLSHARGCDADCWSLR